MNGNTTTGAAANLAAPTPDGHQKMFATVAHVGAANYEVAPGSWYRIGNNWADRCFFACDQDVQLLIDKGLAKPESDLSQQEREKFGVNDLVSEEIEPSDSAENESPLTVEPETILEPVTPLDQLTKRELSELAESLDLNPQGTKKTLIKRINEHYANEFD